MLVLSRKRDESIRISGTITVTVLSVCGGRVRLGIDAPRNVPILRAELLSPVAAATEESPLDRDTVTAHESKSDEKPPTPAAT